MVNANSEVGNTNPQLSEQLHNLEVSRFQTKSSPIFPFVNAQLLTGAYQVFDLTTESKPYSAYVPFTNLKVINTSSQPIYIYFGEIGSNYDVIPANYTNVYTKDDMGGGLATFKIYNAGNATIDASKIVFSVFKSGIKTDDVAQMAFDKLDVAPKFHRYRGLI